MLNPNHRRSRGVLLAVAVLLAAPVGGCLCKPEPKAESHVDVPTKLKEIKKLHDPPDVVVKVKRHKRRQGASPCHSAVCLVLVPFLVAEALFPEKYDVATVTRDGVQTFRGTFRTNGELIQASVREEDEVRVVKALLLRKLGRKVVVEVSRARVDAEGKPRDQKPVSIQSQVDLLGAYSRAMAREKKVEERAALLYEALRQLGDEAMKLALERLLAEREPQRAVLLQKICATSAVRRNAAAVLDLVKREGGPRSAGVVLGRCSRSLKPDRATNEAMFAVLIRAACKGSCVDHVETLRIRLRRTRDSYDAFVAKQVAACKDAHGRTVLRMQLKQKPAAKEIEAVLTNGKKEHRRCAARALFGRKEHLPLITVGLEANPGPLLHEDLMKAQATAEGAMPAGLTAAVLDTYLTPGRTLVARGHALKRLHEVEDRALRKRLLAKVEAALARAPKKERTALGAALVALGKHAAARAAVKAAGSKRTIYFRIPSRPGEIDKPEMLVGYVLRLKGCKWKAIKEALTAVNAGKEVSASLCL